MQLKRIFKMKNKKSLVTVQVLIFLLIGVFVFLFLSYVVPNLLGKGSSQTSDFLGSTNDFDGDGIADFFDKCPCHEEDEEDGDGCDVDHPDGYTDVERETCKAERETT